MKRTTRRMRKALVLIACFALIAGIAIGGTIAWLADTSDTVTNKFTTTDLSVELKESDTTNNEKSYEFVPSVNLSKDPLVTASCDVDYYVFVKVEPAGWTIDSTDNHKYTLYGGDVYCEVDPAWLYLGVDAKGGYVYYQSKKGDDNFSDYVLKGDETYQNGVVVVSKELTDEDMNPATDKLTDISLKFTAYAIQQTGFTGDDAIADAYAAASSSTITTATATAD